MRVADYLMTNYYSHYKGNRTDVIPTREQIDQAIINHPEKMIVVEDGDIRGIAFFLTLTDATYQRLESLDIGQVDVLKELVLENGLNFHFVLLAADSLRTIRIGLRRVIENLHPKTVSWWNPEVNKLYRHEVKR